MGVYIKGMKMPKSCYDCQLCYDMMECSASDIRFFKMKKKAFNFCTERHPNCPLVPVPPHGRLGDLDNLALLVLSWISTQEKAYPHEDSNALAWRLGAKAMGNQIYRDIKAYPTIIPAEEGE